MERRFSHLVPSPLKRGTSVSLNRYTPVNASESYDEDSDVVFSRAPVPGKTLKTKVSKWNMYKSQNTSVNS